MSKYSARRALVACAAFGLLAAACGDDDDSSPAASGDTDTTEETSEAEGEGASASGELTLTLTADGIEASAEEVASGPVEVTFDNQSGAFTEIDLTHVEDGTAEEDFTEGFAPVLAGGPFPDFAIDNAGIAAEDGEATTATVELDAGEYIVWAVPEGPPEGGGEAPEGETEAEAPEREGEIGETPEGEAPEGEAPEGEAPEGEAPEGEEGGGEGGGPPPEAFVTTTLTVTEAESEVEFPETEGTITASDYAFEVDASGPGTYTFVNEGPVQFHHAQIVDFGTNDPEAVETGLPDFLASEEGAPPEGIDPEQIDFEFAGTGVFGPDGRATFEADFTEGNTYAVVCFIQDRSGGAPHAIAHDMYEVFQAG